MNDHRRPRFGEVAGGTAAGCAVVCCCCPLTVMKVAVAMVYKIPTSLFHRIVKKKNIKRKTAFKEALLEDPPVVIDEASEIKAVGLEGRDEAEEDEVWEQFNGAGFWRSRSQRDLSP